MNTNIFDGITNGITDGIDLKPNKLKLILKWGVNFAPAIIYGAFTIGQIKMNSSDSIKDLNKSLLENTQAIKELKIEVANQNTKTNLRIDKIYETGYDAFADYQDYNKKQLNLIIDYGQSNKDLLKKMLEVNDMEKNRNIENNLEQAKSEPYVSDTIHHKIRHRVISGINENK